MQQNKKYIRDIFTFCNCPQIVYRVSIYKYRVSVSMNFIFVYRASISINSKIEYRAHLCLGKDMGGSNPPKYFCKF